jgi:hypothetical protein
MIRPTNKQVTDLLKEKEVDTKCTGTYAKTGLKTLKEWEKIIKPEKPL